MKNMIKMAVAAFLMSGLVASNAMAASTDGTASAEVVVPMTIGVSGPALSFGSFVPNAGGLVAVDAFSGATTSSGTVQLLEQGSNGNFLVAGDPSRTITINLDPIVDLTGPGGTITADLYHTGKGASNEAIGVGGGLPVPAGLAPGAYAGTFSISADY